MSSPVAVHAPVMALPMENQMICAPVEAMAPLKYFGRRGVLLNKTKSKMTAAPGIQMDEPQYWLKIQPPAAPAMPATDANGCVGLFGSVMIHWTSAITTNKSLGKSGYAPMFGCVAFERRMERAGAQSDGADWLNCFRFISSFVKITVSAFPYPKGSGRVECGRRNDSSRSRGADRQRLKPGTNLVVVQSALKRDEIDFQVSDKVSQIRVVCLRDCLITSEVRKLYRKEVSRESASICVNLWIDSSPIRMVAGDSVFSPQINAGWGPCSSLLRIGPL